MSPAIVDLARNLKNAMVRANKLKETVIWSLLILFLAVYSVPAMEPIAASDNLKMVHINTLQEAHPFTNKMVAFTTISGGFNRSYTLRDVRRMFGVMLDAYSCGLKFYYIKQVVPAGAPYTAPYYLDDTSLKDIRLNMRIATYDEIIALYATIDQKINEFNGSIGLAFLQQQLGLELQKKKIA